MKTKNDVKVELAKHILEKEGFYYLEFKNGQLQVDKVNYWATTEKWYDVVTNKKGVGINSFIRHLKEK